MGNSIISNFKKQYEKMDGVGKGVLLIVGGYVVTIVIVIVIVFLAITILMMGSSNCSTMNQALIIVGGAIAVVFLASTIIIAIQIWKEFSESAGRLVTIVIYVAALLASFVIVIFGLLVAFNC